MRRQLNPPLAERLRTFDKGVSFAALGAVWTTVAGLVTIVLVITQLSGAQQGFYFIFASLLLIQQFMELGFGIVLIQFVSHETAFLTVKPGVGFDGPQQHRIRLASLVRLGLRWYGAVAVGFVLIVGAGGYAFFNLRDDHGVDWVIPWLLVTLAAGTGVLMVPFSGMLEGNRQVATNQRLMLYGNVIGAIVSWAVLLAGGALYAIAVQIGLRVIVSLPLLVRSCSPFLELIKERFEEVHFNWRDEFLPQQWRISVSWLAGFLMFQAFAPITFQVSGLVAAGQIGAAAQVYQAINLLAASWLIGVQPRFGQLGAQRDIDGLLVVVHYTIRRALQSALALGLLVLAGFAVLEQFAPERVDRFGGLVTLAVFASAAVLMQPNNVWTAAIRFQKREPFVVISALGALLVVASTALFGHLYGANGVAIGFLATMALVVTPVVFAIFRREIDHDRVRFRALKHELAEDENAD